MAQVLQTANRAYIVCVSTEFGALVKYMKIEQHVNPTEGERSINRIRNQVEQHLFHLFRKSGHHHHVIWEGAPSEADEVLSLHNNCPF